MKILMYLIMFLLPGYLAERYLTYLQKITPSIERRIATSLVFSMLTLFVRCVLAILRGHTALPVESVFGSIWNLVLYTALAGAVIALLPNLIMMVPAAMSKENHTHMSPNKAEETEKAEAKQVE